MGSADRCHYHSRAWGVRCDREAGHTGLCVSGGDAFKSGYIPSSDATPRPAAPTVAPGGATEEREGEWDDLGMCDDATLRACVGIDTRASTADGLAPTVGAIARTALYHSSHRARERAEVETLRALLKEARGCVAVNYGPNEFSRLLHRIDTALRTGGDDATRNEKGGLA